LNPLERLTFPRNNTIAAIEAAEQAHSTVLHCPSV
jgi:hypothetical protein